MSDSTQVPASRSRSALGVAVAIVLLAAATVFLVGRKRPPPTAATALQARLELAAGGVRVDEGTGAHPAVSGQPLSERAVLETQQGARALVRLSDGTSLFLRDGTKITLAAAGISLELGELFMDAPPTDRKPGVHQVGEVTVSGADMGLSLSRKGGEVEAYVARGLATVAGAGGRAEVHAGERCRARGGAAPEVKGVTFWEDWTGGMADRRTAGGSSAAGAGTLYGTDIHGEPGAPSRTLEISRQSVRTVIRDGLAETEVDQTFFNPGARPVEGWYWFSVPEGASVTGFALENQGAIIEGELIERREAAVQYAGAAAAGYQPALLEWVDPRTYRARIFPVPAAGARRAILRYLQRLPLVDGKLRFTHPMMAREPIRIGEFSLSVDLGEEGTRMDLATLSDARIEEGGRRVVMRRTGFKPLADFQLEARLRTAVPPFRVARLSAGGESADYVMARYVPDVAWDATDAPRAEVVLVVDTSAAGDDAARQLRTATAEAVLRSLSASDRFAVVALDVQPVVLYPRDGLAAAEDKEITAALEKLAEKAPGGATDLSAMFDVALGRLHGTEQPALVYVGDGYATSGDLTGEQLSERLSRALSTSRARFFTVAAGGDAHLSLLGELARAGGGSMFVVDEPDQATDRALHLAAAIKTPTITDLEIDLGAGLDEVFTSATGKVSRGQEVVVLARTHHDIPRAVKVRGRLGGKAFEKTHAVSFAATVAASLVPRLWAVEAMRRLLGTVDDEETVRGKIVSMGVEYGLMTPYTSFLALESEHAYQQRGIPRRRGGLRGVRLTSLDRVDESTALAQAGMVLLGATALGCNRSRDAAAPAAQVAAKAEVSLPARDEGRAMEERAPAPASVALAGAEAKDQALAAPAERISSDDANGQDKTGNIAGLNVNPALARMNYRASRQAGAKPQAPSPAVLPTRPAPPATIPPRPCSDVARRPLADRSLVWNKRLATARSAPELVERYDTARATCEMSDWRAEQRFLHLMARYVRDAAWATTTLDHLRGLPESQRHLARLIVRRAVDESLALAAERAVLGSSVNWAVADGELQAIADVEQRITRLRAFLAQSPDDPNGIGRLARLLARAGRVDDALGQLRRLRDRGLLKPSLVRDMGDLLVRRGDKDEAMRVYSEIVEFDTASAASRRLLGDVFLSHAWYGPAYRQYTSLTELDARDWGAWLRLASAAAGQGRIDEALRLERKVSEAEGTPGPDDPRRWARLWSAARLARLIQAPPKDEGDPGRLADSMKRRLKELQLFDSAGSMVIVTWENLSVDLTVLGAATEPAGWETVDAAPVGLVAVRVTSTEADKVALRALPRGLPPGVPVTLHRHDISWDGKAFTVRVSAVELPPDSTRGVDL